MVSILQIMVLDVMVCSLSSPLQRATALKAIVQLYIRASQVMPSTILLHVECCIGWRAFLDLSQVQSESLHV